MSSRVYVDVRTLQLNNLTSLIQFAQSRLCAERSSISCGKADVRLTGISVDSRAYDAARMKDTIEGRSTTGLEARLGAVAKGFTATALGDWRPVPVDLHEEISVSETGSSEGSLRLVEDLECAALDGARMLVFEQLGEDGKPSYVIGLEDVLFDDEGEWKSETAKQAYGEFLDKVAAAQGLALEKTQDDDGGAAPKSVAIGDALEVAGLMNRETQEIAEGRTHSLWSSLPSTGGSEK